KENLLTGAVLYARRSGNVVTIRMIAGKAEETATLVGHPVSRPEIEQVDGEREAAESKLREQADQIARLEQMVDSLKRKPAPERVNAVKPQNAAPQRHVERPSLPLRAAVRQVPGVPLLTPPDVALGSNLTATPPLIGTLAGPAPVPVRKNVKSG